MLIRLIPERGGDGTTCGIIAMNDTGSSVLSLFHSDLPYLGNIQGYNGWVGNVAVAYANGAVNILPMIIVQVKLVRNDNTLWSEWIQELAVVQPQLPGQMRLSGFYIRQALYMGTAPGHNSLL